MKAGDRVRSATDGQVGFLVEGEGGKLLVRLDRKSEDRVVPFHDSLWKPEERARLTSSQIARVCYAADRELRIVRGEYGVPEWQTLTDAARMRSLQSPRVPEGDSRADVYAALQKALANE